MDIRSTVRANRSYRRFDQSKPVAEETLRGLVDLARICPSAMNAQPLRYMISGNTELNQRIFATLSWAGALKDWPGPEPGEQPAAYITVLREAKAAPVAATDVGIASQTILLAATEQGLGGCMLGAIRRDALRAVLAVPAELEIALVIALGTPAEEVVLEDVEPGQSLRYYRTPDQVHHVPKRRLEDILL